MTERKASCQCGALSATCRGEPVRVSVCHCLNCKKRSGSAFAAQARWPADKVNTQGEDRVWHLTADSGEVSEHHFCPTCGSEVWYVARPHRDLIAIPIGNFADPSFPPPSYSVYEDRQHDWVAVVGEEIEHYD
ncbi:GFA family protein [Pontixanthobacter aquaemixtae]|uniref:CENP-V/GFA domain-containing protein n=1 Tax=Pontixanthobacter aquaemixtae TaxID=1958940 RepID=A0A844ZV71_9SPHN|nr:GFA family protein [Pontixanthobacter aquaemixtae]MXO91765.1 hypothetical protein [Pontixanthobacter aquaemixtae]